WETGWLALAERCRPFAAAESPPARGGSRSNVRNRSSWSALWAVPAQPRRTPSDRGRCRRSRDREGRPSRCSGGSTPARRAQRPEANGQAWLPPLRPRLPTLPPPAGARISHQRGSGWAVKCPDDARPATPEGESGIPAGRISPWPALPRLWRRICPVLGGELAMDGGLAEL